MPRVKSCATHGADAHSTARSRPRSLIRAAEGLRKRARWARARGKSRSQPISRVLLRDARVARPMAVIHLGAALPRRSSHLPADSASSVNVRLLGVAPDGGCRVSPAPPRREPRHRDSSLWPCSSPSSPLSRRLITSGRYPASCSAEPGLSSPRFACARRAATVWLTSVPMLARRGALAANAPAQLFASAQRHDVVLSERVFLGDAPRLASQLDGVDVARKPVEVRAMETREALQAI